MKQTFRLILIALSATFILSACSSDSETDTPPAGTTTDKLTVKTVELK